MGPTKAIPFRLTDQHAINYLDDFLDLNLDKVVERLNVLAYQSLELQCTRSQVAIMHPCAAVASHLNERRKQLPLVLQTNTHIDSKPCKRGECMQSAMMEYMHARQHVWRPTSIAEAVVLCSAVLMA